MIEIRARRFVIATGSTPALPPIPGLDKGRYLTNESVFSISPSGPTSLIVIGAGPIGLEMAQAFRRLGSAVTVLEAAAPLAKDDPECAAIVLDQLDREGVVIRSGVKVTRVEHAHRQRRGDVFEARVASRPSKANIYWSPPAASRPSTASISKPPASATIAPASS